MHWHETEDRAGVGDLAVTSGTAPASDITVGELVRPRGIGGSDAAAVCGLDPYRSRVQAWLEMTGRVERAETGEAAYWGTHLEALVRRELVEREPHYLMQVTNIPPDLFAPPIDGLGSHDLYFHIAPWLRGTPDAIVKDTRTEEDGIFEAKTVNAFSREWDDDGVPTRYVLQVSHYMALTGLSFAVIACLIGGQRFVVRRVERDETLIERLIEAEAEFWRHVEQDTPPEPDGSESAEQMLRLLYPEGKGAIQATADDAALVSDYRKLRRAREAAERQEAEAEQKIKTRLGDHETLIWQGAPLARWTTVRSHRFDQKAMREAEPGVYERFQKETSYRRFTLGRERGEA